MMAMEITNSYAGYMARHMTEGGSAAAGTKKKETEKEVEKGVEKGVEKETERTAETVRSKKQKAHRTI